MCNCTIKGEHNVQILRGLSTNRSLLSYSPDGNTIDLWNLDDGSGRQQWKFIPVGDNRYNILIENGTPEGKTYLTYHKNETGVTLEPNNSSEYQEWEVMEIPNSPTCCTYHIKTIASITNGTKFLSAAANSSYADLYYEDDQSGRQKWQLQGLTA